MEKLYPTPMEPRTVNSSYVRSPVPVNTSSVPSTHSDQEPEKKEKWSSKKKYILCALLIFLLGFYFLAVAIGIAFSDDLAMEFLKYISLSFVAVTIGWVFVIFSY